MTGEQEELIQDLKNQVHLLMTRYSELRQKYDLGVLESNNLQEQVNDQKIKIETLEQQYNTAKVATSVLAKDIDVSEARVEINRIVREIDDCIALLNR
ncbi:MAG: hypothetical protein KAH17_04500 [Bacteroidales bacterium]|nr:hypothetical protein [Bacteroidales bacterium]